MEWKTKLKFFLVGRLPFLLLSGWVCRERSARARPTETPRRRQALLRGSWKEPAPSGRSARPAARGERQERAPRPFEETQQKPTYVVKSIFIDFPKNGDNVPSAERQLGLGKRDMGHCTFR